MRPRDLLLFVQRALQVALNRGHDKITQDDIRHAELGYSEEALLLVGYEIEDTHPDLSNAVYSFHGAGLTLSRPEAVERLAEGGLPRDRSESALDLLIWFGVLGVRLDGGDELYAHSVQFNLRRMKHPLDAGRGRFVVHPAFRKALGIGEV
jgi:hypothetical protein